MSYSVQIDVLGAGTLDGITPVDFSTAQTSRQDERIVITIPAPSSFGIFDPGEVVELPVPPYLLMGISVATAGASPLTGGGAILFGPQAPGAAFGTRKGSPIVDFSVATSGIFQTPVLFPFDHCLSIITADAGPTRVLLTLEPFQGASLPGNYMAGRLAT